MTTTQQLGISVLSAPLAAIDRRGLSQAWYSALHLARDSSPICRTAARITQSSHNSQPAASLHPASPRRAAAGTAVRPGAAGRSPSRAGVLIERRSPRSPLARRIERALLDRIVAAPRTSFTIGAAGSRVVVVMHGTGDRIRLIALCPQRSRGAVARALEHVRFALAARGIVLDARLPGETVCS